MIHFKKLRNWFTFNKKKFENQKEFSRYLSRLDVSATFGCTSATCPMASWAKVNGALVVEVDQMNYKVDGVNYPNPAWMRDFVHAYDVRVADEQTSIQIVAGVGISVLKTRLALIDSAREPGWQL